MAVPNPVQPHDENSRIIPLRPRLRKLRIAPCVQGLPPQRPHASPLPAPPESDEAYRHRMAVRTPAKLTAPICG
jgi:hypothetical protein